jgi:hypothetical protein
MRKLVLIAALLLPFAALADEPLWRFETHG